MKKDLKKIKNLTEQAYEHIKICSLLFPNGFHLTLGLLNELGYTKDTPKVFDVENLDCPCTISTLFKDDIADCYITKIYVNNNTIYADLYAYYEQETLKDVVLNNELNTQWENILEYLI